jgi:hypothetical protein
MARADPFSESLLDFAAQSFDNFLRSDDLDFLGEAEGALKVLRRHLHCSHPDHFAAMALLFPSL